MTDDDFSLTLLQDDPLNTNYTNGIEDHLQPICTASDYAFGFEVLDKSLYIRDGDTDNINPSFPTRILNSTKPFRDAVGKSCSSLLKGTRDHSQGSATNASIEDDYYNVQHKDAILGLELMSNTQKRGLNPSYENGTDVSNAKRVKQAKRRFACPFTKAEHTATKLHRACFGRGFENIHRVKEHLYRCHCKPKHLCVRCGKTFQKQSEQDAHLREEIPCSKKDIDLDFDISSEVQESIRTRDSRKKNVTGSEKVDLDEEKWKTIFKLIFPQVSTDDIPLPYVEESMSELKTYLCLDLPDRVANGIPEDITDRLRADNSFDIKRIVAKAVKLSLDEFAKDEDTIVK